MGSKESTMAPPMAASPSQVYVKGVGPGRLLQTIDDDRYEVEHSNSRSRMEHVRENLVSPTRRFDYLRPAADDPSRKVHAPFAVFSLLSTMVGGGVLSLPVAFRESGLIVAVIATCLAALASGFTIDLLIGASRATGADTYELVAKRAFGRGGRLTVMCLLVSLIWLCQIAYLVLLGDLVVPLIMQLPGISHLGSSSTRYIAICGAVTLVSPLCFQKSLSALRFVSFVALLSLLIVVCALGKHAIATWGVDHQAHIFVNGNVQSVLIPAQSTSLWPSSFENLLYVFPIFGLSFLCHFNALPLHTEMYSPTRSRTKRVVNAAMFVTNVLYIIAGWFGYAFSGPFTCGNILLNFDADDVPINIARVALSCSLMFTYPIFLLPLRSNLHQLLRYNSRQSLASEDSPSTETSLQTATNASPEGPAAERPVDSVHPMPQSDNPTTSEHSADVDTEALPSMVHVYDRRTMSGRDLIEAGCFLPQDEVGQTLAWSTPAFIAETLGVMISTVVVACVLKSVLVVWTIAGATVSFMIAFIFPIIIWLKLHADLASDVKVAIAKFLLGLSVLLCIACTWATLVNLSRPACPSP